MTEKIATTIALLALLTGLPTAAAQQQRHGQLDCRVTENGGVASGTMTVRDGDREVATGSCGSAVTVPPGSYRVTLRLDGALDQPERTVTTRVRGGASETATADFATGILEVRITANGRRAAGMATIFRNGDRIGTLGSGVAGHLSAGTYDVVVRYRAEERRFDGVSIARGQRRALSAAF